METHYITYDLIVTACGLFVKKTPHVSTNIAEVTCKRYLRTFAAVIARLSKTQ